ncbi:hypothetical protein Cgig2_007636 [Carnegiea gigantea]|uniref:Uncharacterized protein n=1 Tax=Carnegiea gigantea TaxID=171969 RepID=A0A9Q1JWM6_9CARY|nr:hypothetical protein Cgig2_007636 [Carnegiea gigantea]
MLSDSTTATEPTRLASPSSPSARNSFSTADALTSIAAWTPSATPQPSSATSPGPTPTSTEVSSIRRPAPLPYATLSTLVFHHFGVCLTNEIADMKPMPIITPTSLKHIPFFKTASSVCKFVDDMTQEELVTISKKFGQHVKPCLHSPQITPPPSLLDHIVTLDEKVYELQETVDKLEYIIVQHTDVLDGIAYNQAIIDSRLNNIRTLLTAHISEVYQQPGDLITMRSMTHQCALKAVPLSAA